MARRDPETQLQIAVADFLAIALPPEVYFTAVNPLPGKAGKAVAGLRKAMGLKRGPLDFHFFWPVRQMGWIEMKSDSGRATPEQLDFADRLRAAGIPYDFCRSVEEVERCLRSWGINLKASVGGPHAGSHLPQLQTQLRDQKVKAGTRS